jgi:hypothetical protein
MYDNGEILLNCVDLFKFCEIWGSPGSEYEV